MVQASELGCLCKQYIIALLLMDDGPQMRTHHMERTRQQISLETQSGLGISPGSRALLKRWTFVPVVV